MSSSLLSVHHGCWLPSSKTGMFPVVSLNYSASCASLRGLISVAYIELEEFDSLCSMEYTATNSQNSQVIDRTVIHEVVLRLILKTTIRLLIVLL
jgi:hypothetical protein